MQKEDGIERAGRTVRRHGRAACGVALVWIAVAGAVEPAPAADRLVLGQRLTVSNPAGPERRAIALRAVERNSSDPLVGDPTLAGGAGGAVLEIAALGGAMSWQTFALDQGTRGDGTPYWSAVGTRGFVYVDPKGERGPVKYVRIERTARGIVRLTARLLGKFGPVEVVPPNPGTSGFVALSLSGGDRYCAGFGPDADQHNRGAALWVARSASAERCGPRPLSSGEFLALTYNVAGLPEGISGSHPLTNTPIISPLLNAYDLVVVQESWLTPDPNPLAPLRTHHELLVADADHPYKSVPLPAPLGTDPERPTALVSDGLAVFSRFPFTGVVHEPWATCVDSAADCLARKGFMVARTTIAPGVAVDVYDLHMEAGSDPLDDVARDQGVTQLVELINTYSAGRAVIVGGDFNLHTDEEPDSTQFQRLLAETGLSDVCATLSCPQPGRIDKFLFRSGGGVTLAPLSWRFETDVFVDPMGEPLSDHDALAVRFAWQTADDVDVAPSSNER